MNKVLPLDALPDAIATAIDLGLQFINWPEEWGHHGLISEACRVATTFPQTPSHAMIVSTKSTELKAVKRPLTEPAGLLYDNVVLMSGGFDCMCGWLMLAKNSISRPTHKLAVWGDTKSDYSMKELAALKKWNITPVDLNYVPPRTRWAHIIPARNLALIALASKHVTDGGAIHIGVVQGEAGINGDKSPTMMRLIEKLIRAFTGKVVRISTLESYTKNDLLDWYLKSYGHFRILTATVSCFGATDGPCGACQACVRRWISIVHVGADPAKFFPVDPVVEAAAFMRSYIVKLSSALENDDYSHYSRRRAQQDLAALRTVEARL